MKGIIFDFDGPIYDGRKAAFKALTATYDQFAGSIGRPQQSMESGPLFSPKQMIGAAYAEFGLARDPLDEVREYYSAQLKQAEHEFEVPHDVITLLDELRGRGCKLAILSGRTTTNVTELVKHLGLADRFDGVWSKKVDADTVSTIADKLNLQIADLVLVGDSDTDYWTAKNAGIPYYHVAWSDEPTSVAHTRANAVATSVAELSAILQDDEPLSSHSSATLPPQLLEAIRLQDLSFYAGAGASAPSGVGSWAGHYLPVLRQYFPLASLLEDRPFPEMLQLLATNQVIASDLFNRFRTSFQLGDKRANAYHYALLKSRARTVWTTNYDQLFEQAINAAGFAHKVVKTDSELINNFGSRSLVIKMNGDFEGAKYQADLDWDMVFLEEQFDTAELERREIWRLFEDDYRNKLIIFIGVSFSDPALRRILSVAAKAIPRSRYEHLLLMKEPDQPLERTRYRLYAETLKRRYIQTVFFPDFPGIERFVCRIAAQAKRPIIGFSGTAHPNSNEPQLPGGFLDRRQVAEFCKRSGRALALQQFRVTSGHGEGVGVPAVVAAFEQNPTLARFYLRRRGTTAFSRTAPAIVVLDDTLEAMRERFVSELDLLIAVGGENTGEPTSGTIQEIKLAISRQVPVLLVPQAGGDAACFQAELEACVKDAFPTALVKAIRTANATIAAKPPDDLLGFASAGLPELVSGIIAQLMGAAIRRPRDALEGAPGDDW